MSPASSTLRHGLGVSRMHLWYVLKGFRTSPGLLARYSALTGSAAILPAAPHGAHKTPKGHHA